jgi:pyruvate ferredoxin oxidoreductase delta subunit
MTDAKKAAAAGKPAVRTRKTAAKAAKTAPPKPAWDISDIDSWGASRHELGATIPEAGNSVYNETGGWRTNVPTIDPEKCTGCMLCYFFCPDASIVIEDGKATGVDLVHCKGCGICATECPADAITMSVEEKE